MDKQANPTAVLVRRNRWKLRYSFAGVLFMSFRSWPTMSEAETAAAAMLAGVEPILWKVQR